MWKEIFGSRGGGGGGGGADNVERNFRVPWFFPSKLVFLLPHFPDPFDRTRGVGVGVGVGVVVVVVGGGDGVDTGAC